MRKRYWLLLPAPVLLLAGYLALPMVAQLVIESWLREQGFQSVNIQFNHPGWTRLSVPSLALQQRSDDYRIELDSGSIQIDYDPLELLLKRRVSEIRIPRLTLNVTSLEPVDAPLDLSDQVDLNALPPALIFQYAPSQRLVVGQITLNYGDRELPPIRIQGNLDLTPELLLSRMRVDIDDNLYPTEPAWLDLQFNRDQWFDLALLHENRSLLKASGQLNTNTDRWGSNLELELALAPLQRWLKPVLPPGLTDLETGQLTLALTADWPALLPLEPLPLAAQLNLRSASHLEAGLTDFTHRDFKIGDLSLDLMADFSLEGGRAELTLQPSSTFRANKVEANPLTAEESTIRLREAFSASALVTGPLLEISPLQVTLSSRRLSAPPLDRVELTPLQLTLTPSAELDRFSYQLAPTGISAVFQGRALPTAEFTASGHWTPTIHTGHGTLRAKQYALDFSADWRLEPASIRADWRFEPIELTSLRPLLAQWLPGWPLELQLTHGQAHLQGILTGPSVDRTRAEARFDIRNAALSWDSFLETDQLNLSGEARMDPDGALTLEGQLEDELIRTGVDLHDLAFDFQLSHSNRGEMELQLSPFAVRLLGGEMRMPSLRFDPLAPKFETRIDFERIELSEILALYQQPGLAGDTPLRGSLPLAVDGTQIRIREGQVTSISPGWLRYEPDASIQASARANPGLNLAVSALSNLQIKQLDLDVNYAPDGSLELKSRLQGQNPDWQQGRPIDLTVNIEENLVQLFRSLQLSDRIGESLQQRFNR